MVIENEHALQILRRHNVLLGQDNDGLLNPVESQSLIDDATNAIKGNRDPDWSQILRGIRHYWQFRALDYPEVGPSEIEQQVPNMTRGQKDIRRLWRRY